MLRSYTSRVFVYGQKYAVMLNNLQVSGFKRQSPKLMQELDTENENSISNIIKTDYSGFTYIKTTPNRTHQFEVSCDTVLRFINLGFLNKMLAAQYCHHLAQISQDCTEGDKAYYSHKAMILMKKLIGSKELPDDLKTPLICNVARISEESCNAICDMVFNDTKICNIVKNSGRSFSSLLSACYIADNLKAAKNLLNLYTSYCIDQNIIKPLTEFVYRASKRPNLSKPETIEYIDHLCDVLEFVKKKKLVFTKVDNLQFIQSLKDLGLSVNVDPVFDNDNQCKCCKQLLPSFDDDLVKDVHYTIKEILFMKMKTKTHADDKLFVHSHKKELAQFETLVKKIESEGDGPIDLVVDGLNVCYLPQAGTKYIEKELVVKEGPIKGTKRTHDSKSLAYSLIAGIKVGELHKRFNKILVVGRDFMKEWPEWPVMRHFFSRNNIHFHASDKRSRDDLFTLYAATLHPKTFLLSNDLYRDHVAYEIPEIRKKIERWLETHQIFLRKQTLKPIWPQTYDKDPSVFREKGIFHIPLDARKDHEHMAGRINQRSVLWICCNYRNLHN